MPLIDKQTYQSPAGVLVNRFALEREAVHMFGYNSANPGTLRAGSGGQGKNAGAEDWRTNADRRKLIWEARDLEKQVCFVKGTLDNIGLYAVPRLSYQPMTSDPAINEAYKDYFHKWAHRCDVTERFTLRKMCWLALRSMLRDGDCGIAMSRQVPNQMMSEIRLRLIEADRIGNEKDGVNTDKMQGGINLNENGAPISYRIYKRTITNNYIFESAVKANDFIHFVDPLRADQYRGLTAFAQCGPHLRNLYELFGFEMVAAKFAASFSAFIGMKDPLSQAGASAFDKPSQNGMPATMDVQAGKIVRFDSENEEMHFAPGATRPSGAFMSLVNAIIREIAIGLNLPYGFIYDMSILGGATARIEVMRCQRVFQYWQRMLEDIMLDRVKNLVLAVGISRKEIPASPEFQKGKWHWGAWLTADVGYQTQADIQLIQLGLKSKTQFCEENDIDHDELIRTNVSEAMKIHTESVNQQVPEELVAGGNPAATSFWQAINDAQDPQKVAEHEAAMQPPPPPPGLIGQAGDKGVAQLVDIAEKVATGMLDRTVAVNQVTQIFGIPPEAAEMMIPKYNSASKRSMQAEAPASSNGSSNGSSKPKSKSQSKTPTRK